MLIRGAAGHEFNQYILPVGTVTPRSLPTSNAKNSNGSTGARSALEENGGPAHDRRSTRHPKLIRTTGDIQYDQYTMPIGAATQASASTSRQEDRAVSDQNGSRLPAGDCSGHCSVILGFAIAYTQRANSRRATVASFRCSKCGSECSVITNPQKTEGEMGMSE